MSPWTYTASASSAAMRWPAWADDAELTTIPAPRPERRRATAAPIPLDDPVTMTALPVRSIPVPLQLAGGPLSREPSPQPSAWPARWCCSRILQRPRTLRLCTLYRAEPAGRDPHRGGPGPARAHAGLDGDPGVRRVIVAG